MQKSAILIPYSVQIEKNILKSEHSKGSVWRISAPAFKRLQKIVQCERSLIDNIFTNAVEFNVISGNILTQISDHFPKILILKNLSLDMLNASHCKHEFTNFNEGDCLEDLNSINLDFINGNMLDVNYNFSEFLKEIYSLSEKHASIKKLSEKAIKLKARPWINGRILKTMR